MGGLCQVGSFCEKGLTYECEPGTFMSVTGSSECKITRIGYYQDQSGQDTALDCPEGKYCDQNGLASTPENCTVGTYYSGTNLISSSSCTPCDPGYVCPETGLTSSSEICLSGTFCPGGNAQQNDNICDQGYYCPEGSIAQQICLPGTYCPLGATEMTNCTAGYHCIEGSVTARGVTDTNGEKRCSVGHYCPEATPTEVIKFFVYILILKKEEKQKEFPKKLNIFQIECATGFINPITGAVDDSACIPCPEGLFCEAANVGKDQNQQSTCSSGYLCPEGSFQDKVEICSEYNKCDAGISTTCQDGFFQNEEGKSICLPCPKGQICPTGAAPVACDAGKICSGETIPGGATDCPIGSYGDSTASFYSDESDCIFCDSGKHCAVPGLLDTDLSTATYDCPDGYYCLDGKDPEECEAGYYCPQGSSWHIACEPGFFNPNKGESTQS